MSPEDSINLLDRSTTKNKVSWKQSGKIVPEEFISLAFRPPIPSTPNMYCYNEQFVKRFASIPPRFRKLNSGRRICYFDDDDGDESNTVVVCFHDQGQGKYIFLPKQHIDGLRVIGVDLFGTGGSSPEPENALRDEKYSIDELKDDLIEFLRRLKIKNLYIVGHGTGSLVCQVLTAQLQLQDQSCVKGLILIGGLPPPLDVSVDEKMMLDIKSTLRNPLDLTGKGMIQTWRRMMLRLHARLNYIKDNSRDWGFAKYYVKVIRLRHGSNASTLEKMDQDHYLISKILYSSSTGYQNTSQYVNEYSRLFTKPTRDMKDITCPVYIYHGSHDKVLPATITKYFLGPYPNAKIITLDGFGHSSILLELDNILKTVCLA
ncbi:Alpha/Beta hydrolase protein [Globomyces pollinis-pini]|nr:Alpha/Beta hydrolase protein [Globomyces pollinis-pini]